MWRPIQQVSLAIVRHCLQIVISIMPVVARVETYYGTVVQGWGNKKQQFSINYKVWLSTTLPVMCLQLALFLKANRLVFYQFQLRCPKNVAIWSIKYIINYWKSTGKGPFSCDVFFTSCSSLPSCDVSYSKTRSKTYSFEHITIVWVWKAYAVQDRIDSSTVKKVPLQYSSNCGFQLQNHWAPQGFWQWLLNP